jgi:FAD/FMN-containing dehydrogenase
MQLLTPNDAGYADEVIGWNLAAESTPDVVVAATSASDIVEAVRYARTNGHELHVQGTGHGGPHPIRSGLLVSTKRLDSVRVDGDIATIGAGAKWAAVVAAAAPHGLAPITGSSTTVGVVGYLLGGGFGPLARSHGISSDYLVGATVVTGDGELVEATDDHLWALRGGKFGLGIVVEVRIRLVPLRTLYAGALIFDEPNIEAALRAWVEYTTSADKDVTTSVAIARFPPIEAIPEPLRGRRVLALRFAYPGSIADGERLAAPLRAAAPIYIDDLRELAAADVAKIHNDPPGPVPSWARGALLDRIDQELATTLLGHVGAGTDAPFIAVECRHLGNATARDVAGGSAVGGRGASFTASLIGVPQPELFAEVIPRAADGILASFARWRSTEENINFLGEPAEPERIAHAWPREIHGRLDELRRRFGGPAHHGS